MSNIRLGLVDVIFKVSLTQTTSVREINEMRLALKRYPTVSSVVVYSGDNALEEADSHGRLANLPEKEGDRVFPAD